MKLIYTVVLGLMATCAQAAETALSASEQFRVTCKEQKAAGGTIAAASLYRCANPDVLDDKGKLKAVQSWQKVKEDGCYDFSVQPCQKKPAS
jgi:hypothetical protein